MRFYLHFVRAVSRETPEGAMQYILLPANACETQQEGTARYTANWWDLTLIQTRENEDCRKFAKMACSLCSCAFDPQRVCWAESC